MNPGGRENMKNARCYRSTSLLFCACALIFFSGPGCSLIKGPGPTPRYFVLSPVDTHDRNISVRAGNQKGLASTSLKEKVAKRVIVGPVEIPAYLDRPQIVRLADGNRLQASERNRWAEPLAGAIERVVAMDISRMAHGEFAVRPFFLDTPLEGGSGYRVLINIYAFEQKQNGDVILDCQWTLTSVKQNRQIFERHENFTAYAKNETFEETVKVMNSLLHMLSKDIFLRLKEL